MFLNVESCIKDVSKTFFINDIFVFDGHFSRYFMLYVGELTLDAC